MSSLGFGLEKLGLAAIRWPLPTLAVILLTSLLAGWGISRLSIDASISGFYRSGTPEYTQYARLKSLFPASEYDVLAIIEAPDLMRPEALRDMLDLHLELGFAGSVDHVLSMFSMRDPPGEDGISQPVIPDIIPDGPEFKALAARIAAHPLIKDQFLSQTDADGQLALMVIAMRPETVARQGLEAATDEIASILQGARGKSGLQVRLSGIPVMHKETLEGIRRDQIIFNSFGLLIGMIVSWYFFRRPVLVFTVAVVPPMAAFWALGLLGLWGQDINVLINIIPPIMMVITFCDAMHLVFALRRGLRRGLPPPEAARHAVRTVGPACVLTSLTTSIALLALSVTELDLIRNFGFAAAACALLSFFVVISVVPALAVLLIRDEKSFAKNSGTDRPIKWIEVSCHHIANLLQRHYLAILGLGICAIPLFAWLYLQLEPSYRLIDQVPTDMSSIAASKRLDATLGGSYPMHILMRWPKGRKFLSAEVQRALEDAHELMQSLPEMKRVSSLVTLKRWLRQGGGDKSSPARNFAATLEKMPPDQLGRFLNSERRAALITGQLPNLKARHTSDIFKDLERRTERLRRLYPGYEFIVTGLTSVLAVQTSSMISQLNQGLVLAIVIGIVLIGIAFRSPGAAALSILPNVFPVVAAGASLHLMGEGLQFISVIALTVAFGLAIDDTIHFLNRLYIEHQGRTGRIEAVDRAVRRIGPVLILTSLIIFSSTVGILLSSFYASVLFGKLIMITVAAALIGDLLILPALIIALNKLPPLTFLLRK